MTHQTVRVSVTHIIGRLCSGKTTRGRDLANARRSATLDTTYVVSVDVSDVVKQIVNSTDRSVLQSTGNLVDSIINWIDELIERMTTIAVGGEYTDVHVFIIGARQLKIVQHFAGEIICIHTPREERLRRFLERQANKDGNLTEQQFDIYDQRDRELGLDEVFNHVAKQIVL